MVAVKECKELSECLPEYVEGTLSNDHRAHVETHLVNCQDCRAAVARFREMQGLLHTIVGP